MSRLIPCVLALLAATMPATSATIVLGADPWCPYNCDPHSDRPGFMVEVAQEALAPYGHEVRYVTVSWARGIRQAETGEIDGVIGAIPEEVPHFVFGPPIGTYEDTIVFRRGEAMELEDLATVSGMRIGAINGYEYFGPVSDYIEANADSRDIVQFASGDDALYRNLRKLVAGRLDMVAEVRAVLDYAIAEMGIADEVDILVTNEFSELYIAFSPALDTSPLLAQQLKDGVAALRASGRYAEILARYGL